MTFKSPTLMHKLMQKAPAPEDALADAEQLKPYLALESVPVPVPGPGQVLIKVARGSMNPNDLYHIKGVYSSTFDYPMPRGVGFEGSGLVVAAGSGILPRLRLGKRVAFYSKDGVFSEYVVADALKLLVIPDEVSFADAASAVVNPITGTGMAQWAKKSGSQYFFITAAAGAVARMTMRVAHSYGLKSIAIIRREEQAAICKHEGASYVLNQSDPDFEQRLTTLLKQVNCHYGFDCIGGDMPVRLMRCMPQGSTLCMYGYFNTGPMQFAPQKVFNGWNIDFFETEYYLADLSLLQRFRLSRDVMSKVNTLFKPKIQAVYPLEEAHKAYQDYHHNMTDGKVQIVADPHLI